MSRETRASKVETVTSWLPHLKKHFPLSKPVRMRYVDHGPPGYEHGGCDVSRSGKSFVLTLSLHNSSEIMLEWLMHEWTHARMWEHGNDHEVHPPEFWVQFGRIRNHCVDYNFQDPIHPTEDSYPGGTSVA